MKLDIENYLPDGVQLISGNPESVNFDSDKSHVIMRFSVKPIEQEPRIITINGKEYNASMNAVPKMDSTYLEIKWQNAKEEFVNRAFERFDDNDLSEFLDSNEVTEYYISLRHDIQLKPLSELFQHDVSVYGDNAYQMIEISLSDKKRFIDATDNKDVEWALNSTNYDVRRKTSAALPFDLTRAKAGDVVEWFDGKSWKIWVCSSRRIDKIFGNEQNLRMKYPQKLISKVLK